MASELTQNAIDVVLDPRTAWSVSGGTAGAGITEWFLHIPWPAIVTATGSIFSIIFGIIHIWKFVIDRRIRLLEEQILEQKIDEH